MCRICAKINAYNVRDTSKNVNNLGNGAII
jgi:hypothetical protein